MLQRMVSRSQTKSLTSWIWSQVSDLNLLRLRVLHERRLTIWRLGLILFPSRAPMPSSGHESQRHHTENCLWPSGLGSNTPQSHLAPNPNQWLLGTGIQKANPLASRWDQPCGTIHTPEPSMGSGWGQTPAKPTPLLSSHPCAPIPPHLLLGAHR